MDFLRNSMDFLRNSIDSLRFFMDFLRNSLDFLRTSMDYPSEFSLELSSSSRSFSSILNRNPLESSLERSPSFFHYVSITLSLELLKNPLWRPPPPFPLFLKKILQNPLWNPPLLLSHLLRRLPPPLSHQKPENMNLKYPDRGGRGLQIIVW